MTDYTQDQTEKSIFRKHKTKPSVFCWVGYFGYVHSATLTCTTKAQVPKVDYETNTQINYALTKIVIASALLSLFSSSSMELSDE